MMTFVEKKKWLEGLQVGDEVLATSGNIRIPNSVATVTRITATRIYVSGDRFYFRRKDGYRPGFGSGTILPATDEAKAAARRHQAVRNARAAIFGIDIGKISDDDAIAVAEAIKTAYANHAAKIERLKAAAAPEATGE